MELHFSSNSPVKGRMRVRWGALIAAGALGASLATACTSASGYSTASDAGARASLVMGDPARGKQVFSAVCASCHGPTGAEGGIGPSLTKENKRKDYAQTIAWIKNPEPPMRKLYPAPLDEHAVDDVAAYVQGI
jgi:mono/diheme cytochrome c family protein